MKCPRDHTQLVTESDYGFEVDRCPECSGRWLDYDELDKLEASTGATESERRATIEYGEHPSELDCPVCGKRMITFNYRAYNLELDECGDGHGYWLDAGEEGRVRDIVNERVRGLERSPGGASSEGSKAGAAAGSLGAVAVKD